MDFNYPMLWILVLLFLVLVGVGIYFSVAYKQKALPILYPEELSFTVNADVLLQIEILAEQLIIDWGDGNTTVMNKQFTGKIVNFQKANTTVNIKGNNIVSISFPDSRISSINFINCPNLQRINLSDNFLNDFAFPNYKITNLNLYDNYLNRSQIDFILSTIRSNGLYSKIKDEYSLNLAGRHNNYPSVPTGYQNKAYIINNLQWEVITN